VDTDAPLVADKKWKQLNVLISEFPLFNGKLNSQTDETSKPGFVLRKTRVDRN
jgi:hypothetical protein